MFWCAYHTWIWPFLFASRSCSFLFPKWITGNSLRKCVCVCVSSHLEDQVLISWFLAISKLAFTGTFTGSPLFLMGVKTWFTIKFSKQINSAIVFFSVLDWWSNWAVFGWAAHSPESIQRSNWVQPEGSEISWHRYGADLHYTATGRSWLGKVAGFLWVSGICWAKNGGIFDHSR